MKKLIVFTLAALLFAMPVMAQTATPGNNLAFDQAAPSLTEAQAYTYQLYADGSSGFIGLTNVVCAGTASPFQCTVQFPAFTPGAHTLQLTASNAAGESAKSAVFSFTFVVQPAAPTNLRIQ